VLRMRIGSAASVAEGELTEIAVPGLRWPVIATRLEGEIVVTAGVCPHEDVALSDGKLRGSLLTCPGHGYELDLRTGRCRHDPSLRLPRYPVTIVDGEVWIELVARGE
jgi:nitrite reductase/ring-hydroxylating ferredoxin subunit